MSAAHEKGNAWTSPDHAEWQLLRGAVAKGASLDEVSGKVVNGAFEDVLKARMARPMIEAVAQTIQASLQNVLDKSRVIVPFTKVQMQLPSPHEALCVAIAALHTFVQLNWTGPEVALQPDELMRMHAPQYMPPRSVDGDDENDDDTYARTLHASSLEYLTWHGEPAYHLCQSPFYLVFALLILDALAENGAATLSTLAWWRLRARSVQLRLLDEAMACEDSIWKEVEALTTQLKKAAQENEKDRFAWSHLCSRLALEMSIAHQRAGHDRVASEGLVEAARVNGLQYELSGALGKRTKWQKEAKTQLVVLAESRYAGQDKSEEDSGASSSHAIAPDGWQPRVDPSKQVDHQPTTYSLNDDTLLERTEFTQSSAESGRALSHLDPGDQPPLAVLDQCILLGLCLDIHNTQASHGLTSEQMSAFLERVILQPQNWSVHTMSLLLRARLEATRTRTIERSTLQLQTLIDQMPSNDSSVRERLRFFHALDLPAKWMMQAELAHRYLSIGVLRSALETYERIEMWEQVVQCLGMLGRHAEGIEVVRDLLSGRKMEAPVQLQAKRIATAASRVPHARFARAHEAKLWCLLGDLEPEHAEEHYARAWEVSGASSARAARSLGAYHFALHAYEHASVWLRRAVRINALFTRTWFMLGCAYMRMEKWVEAASAFRKCTSLEEEDGESWNNLASCYMRMHKEQVKQLDRVLELDEDAESVASGTDSGIDVESQDEAAAAAAADTDADADADAEAVAPAIELRLLAHKALGVSLKYQFESWRVWTNYMVVSVDVGMLSEAARAMTRVVEIRTHEQSCSTSRGDVDVSDMVDMGVLNKLVDAVIRPHDADDEVHNKHAGVGLQSAVLRLFEQTLLPRFTTSPPIWQSYARLMFAMGHFRATLEARIQSFQSGAGSADSMDVVTDKSAWLRAKDELQDVCDALMNLGGRPALPDSHEEAMPDWRFRARTLVRTFMSRTRDSFEDEAEWAELQELLEDLKR